MRNAITKTGYKIFQQIKQFILSENNVFTGTVNLTKSLTHYAAYSITSNIVISIGEATICGGAYIRMIGDGSHTPDFSAFKKLNSSEDFDTTLNAVNMVSFGYDGNDYYYSISLEATV